MKKAWLLANKWIWVIALSCISVLSQAVSLGGIAVYSYLNEPLSAEIQINDLDPGLADQITAELGSPQDFMKANIERQTFLNDLHFEVSNIENKLYVYIYSYENLKNPYLELLLKLRWKDGSLLKNYTLLVDPLPNNISQRSRAHPISEATALERRNLIQEKRIDVKNLMQQKEDTLSDSYNKVSSSQIMINDNVLMEGVKNAEAHGLLTFSDASFDSLVEQTNKALEKNAKPTQVNFDAEDEVEKSQIANVASNAMEARPQDKLLPIKSSSQTHFIDMANLAGKYGSNPMSVAHQIPSANTTPASSIATTESSIATPISSMQDNNFPVDMDKVLNNPIQHEIQIKEPPVNQDIHITEKTKELPEFKAHDTEILHHSAPEYKSQLLNFVIISVLTLSLLAGLIIIYRKYKNRSDTDTDYNFNSKNIHEIKDDILDEEDLDEFNDQFDDKESIDRKSIDADIETYQKQLSDADAQQYVDNKIKSSTLPKETAEYITTDIVLENVTPVILEKTLPESSEINNEIKLQTEILPPLPVQKINPSSSFDIAAARAGNSTGMQEPKIDEHHTEDSNMIVEVGDIDHYDLSAYKSEQDKSLEKEKNKTETKEDNLLGFPEVNVPSEEIIQITPPKDTMMIDDFASGVESIKLADDDKPLQVINRYDDKASLGITDDHDDFDLDLEDHHLEIEGTAAFDNFDEANIKLDLAKQYFSAGDLESAKEVANEIIEIGNTAQKEIGQELLDKIQQIEK